MAAPLTWRNVDAPDFRGSMDGYRIAGNAFERAFAGLSEGLGKFDANRKDITDNALALAASRYATPEALQAAQASGELMRGLDPSLVRAKALAGVDDRVGSLLNQAVNQQGLNTSRQLDPIRIQQAGLNTQVTSQKLDQDAQLFPTVLAQGQANVQQTNLNNSLARRSEDSLVSLRGSQADSAGLNYDAGRWRFGVEKEDREAGSQAASLLSTGMRGSATVDDALAFVSSPQFTQQPMRVQEAALKGMESRFGPIFGNITGGSGPGGARAGSGEIAASPYAQGSFRSLIPFKETRDYVERIGSKVGTLTGSNEEKAVALLPHMINQESGGKEDARSPKGAFGLMQLMPATARQLEQKLGMQPGETDRNPEANKRAGLAYVTQMLDDNGGDVDKALASYNAGPGRVAEWLKNSPAATSNRASAALGEINNRVGQDRAQLGALSVYADTMKDDRDYPTILKGLRDSGAFPNVNDNVLTNAINDIRGRTGNRINYATAARILNDNLQGAGLLGRALDLTNVRNSDGINAQIDMINKGGLFDSMDRQQRLANTGSRIQTAQTNYEDASKMLAQVSDRARVTGSPELRERISVYEKKMQDAQKLINDLLKEQEKDRGTAESPGPRTRMPLRTASN